MNAIAVIPARGGSKGLPRKNVRPLCGKPLIAWTIETALRAETVGKVVVSTDDEEIGEVSARWGAHVVWRPAAISGDTAPSEEALLHALRHLGIDEGVLVFLQCTAPLILPEDVDGTVRALEGGVHSAFTAAPWHQFPWRLEGGSAVPVGHTKTFRPRRQDRTSLYVEVGAVYAMDIARFLQEGHRFPGPTALYPIPRERSVEIDDETDFFIAEALMERRLKAQGETGWPQGVEAVVTDFDGVLTDNRVHVHEGGTETVTCHRGDGWAIGQLRQRGIRLLVLTHEENAAVRRRCEKLGVECLVAQGDKLPILQRWLARHGVDPKATVYVGNDVPDVACLRFVGWGVAPADAHEAAKGAARIVLRTPGGWGCLRELADGILTKGGKTG